MVKINISFYLLSIASRYIFHPHVFSLPIIHVYANVHTPVKGVIIMRHFFFHGFRTITYRSRNSRVRADAVLRTLTDLL